MRVVCQILEAFGGASGLHTNLAKSEAFPIGWLHRGANRRCLGNFPGEEGLFPMHLSWAAAQPLHYSRLKAAHFQPVIGKLGARLAAWRGKHFTRAGRVLLCRSVLSAMVIYHLPVFRLPKWVIRRIEKIQRGFLWMKPGVAPGARPHPLVNWGMVCRPKKLGGMACSTRRDLGMPLRMRWSWYSWMDQSRPRHGIVPGLHRRLGWRRCQVSVLT